MKSEEAAREDIDNMLELSGWKIQDLNKINLGEDIGIAVREAHLKAGFSDYFLFVDRRPVSIIRQNQKASL